ncbi:Nucleoporin nup146 [Neolecta irregularis DAH-3]|uniref:Nucleoporin nup146 n=1 Tax=Neolecta irregularis (strain DAH-3) TaxID=1198029 RepID=A0A1U7LJA9_NEOID|nr:Nucleoporin nup146 [Neolecta irregularis DAH-3]|eukprot:OLL22611.1 Nucleoporin nup146 [Neolecta irregularis DAH-3]
MSQVSDLKPSSVQLEEIDGEEIDVETVAFRPLRQDTILRLFSDGFNGISALPESSLLAVNNYSGLLVGASTSEFVVETTKNIRNSITSATFKFPSISSTATRITVTQTISHVIFSPSGNEILLGFEDGKISSYDVASLRAGSEPKFDNSTTPIQDLQANPSPDADLVAILTKDRVLRMLSMSKRQLLDVVLAEVTAICWSQKGKQIICGMRDGSLVQITPDGQKKAELKRAPALDSHYVSKVCWLENHLFLVVYHVPEEDTVHLNHQYEIYIISSEEKDSIKYIRMPDPAPPFGLSERGLNHFFLALKNWSPYLSNFVVVSATPSADIGIISRSKPSNKWATWSISDETKRALLPYSILADHESSPLGLAFDFTSRDPIPLAPNDDPSQTGPVPIFYILNTDGFLSAYHILYLDAVKAGIRYDGILLSSSSGSPIALNVESVPETKNIAENQFNSTVAFGSSVSKAPSVGLGFGFGGNGVTSAPSFGSSLLSDQKSLAQPFSVVPPNSAMARNTNPGFLQPFGNLSFETTSFTRLGDQNITSSAKDAAITETKIIDEPQSLSEPSKLGQQSVFGTLEESTPEFGQSSFQNSVPLLRPTTSLRSQGLLSGSSNTGVGSFSDSPGQIAFADAESLNNPLKSSQVTNKPNFGFTPRSDEGKISVFTSSRIKKVPGLESSGASDNDDDDNTHIFESGFGGKTSSADPFFGSSILSLNLEDKKEAPGSAPQKTSVRGTSSSPELLLNPADSVESLPEEESKDEFETDEENVSERTSEIQSQDKSEDEDDTKTEAAPSLQTSTSPLPSAGEISPPPLSQIPRLKNSSATALPAKPKETTFNSTQQLEENVKSIPLPLESKSFNLESSSLQHQRSKAVEAANVEARLQSFIPKPKTAIEIGESYPLPPESYADKLSLQPSVSTITESSKNTESNPRSLNPKAFSFDSISLGTENKNVENSILAPNPTSSQEHQTKTLQAPHSSDPPSAALWVDLEEKIPPSATDEKPPFSSFSFTRQNETPKPPFDLLNQSSAAVGFNVNDNLPKPRRTSFVSEKVSSFSFNKPSEKAHFSFDPSIQEKFKPSYVAPVPAVSLTPDENKSSALTNAISSSSFSTKHTPFPGGGRGPSRHSSLRGVISKKPVSSPETSFSTTTEITRVMAVNDEEAAKNLEEKIVLPVELRPIVPLDSGIPPQSSQAGLTKEFELVYLRFTQELELLGENTRNLSRFVDAHSEKRTLDISDLGADIQSACHLGGLHDLSRTTEYFLKQSVEFNSDRNQHNQAIHELKNSLIRLEAKQVEIARFIRAKTDPDFAKMVKARQLGPEHSEQQRQLRNISQHIDSQLQQAEEQFSIIKAAVSSRVQGRNLQPSAEKIRRAIDNITADANRKAEESNKLERKLKRMSVTQRNMPQKHTPFCSTPKVPRRRDLLNTDRDIARSTADVLNKERFCMTVKVMMKTMPPLRTEFEG